MIYWVELASGGFQLYSRLMRGALALAMIVIAPQTAHADDWLRADTDNFIIWKVFATVR